MKYSWKKYSTPLRILNSFIKSFVNPFIDIALTFFGSSFNSILFTFFSFLSKLFLQKLAISLLLAKFAFTNLAAEFSAVHLLNFGLVIYLSWSWSVIFFSISLIFVL